MLIAVQPQKHVGMHVQLITTDFITLCYNVLFDVLLLVDINCSDHNIVLFYLPVVVCSVVYTVCMIVSGGTWKLYERSNYRGGAHGVFFHRRYVYALVHVHTQNSYSTIN